MPRTEPTREYESMIVLRADLPENGVPEQIERVKKLLESNGATITAVHEWGVRELAYEIEKQRRGFYVLVEYDGTAAAVAELERQLKLSDVVLRFVSVRREKGMPAASAQPFEGQAGESSDRRDSDEDDDGGGAEMEMGDVE